MRRLILHIGTPKTGSTSLQEVLAAGRPGLAKSGVYYPRKIGPVNHIALADALLDPERRRLGPATNRKAHEIREALMLNAFAAEINGLPSSIHTVVISNESFCFKAASAAEFAKLKEILEPHFDVIEIVIYLRRQDEHYASIYGQGLRQGYLQRPMPVHGILNCDLYYDYDAMIRRWETAFPNATFRPRIFERPESGRFDVIEDFFSIVGVPVPELTDGSLSVSNVSINAEGQKVLLRMRAVMKDHMSVHFNANAAWPIWTIITRTMEKLYSGKGWRMTNEQSAEFMRQWETGNQAICERYFPQRKKLFRDAPPSGDDNKLAEDKVAMQAACAVIKDLSDQLRLERLKLAEMMVTYGEQFKDATLLSQGMLLQIEQSPAEIDANLAIAQEFLDKGWGAQARGALSLILKAAPQNNAAKHLIEELRHASPVGELIS